MIVSARGSGLGSRLTPANSLFSLKPVAHVGFGSNNPLGGAADGSVVLSTEDSAFLFQGSSRHQQQTVA